MAAELRTLRASEIGEYVFCRRAWWLRSVQGYASANVRELVEGAETHARHGRAVGAARALQALALVLIVIAVVLVILGRG
jgi:hypothetical protein